MRREEGDGLIAPVVDPACRRIEGIELKDREELYGRDPQIFQVGNLLDQPGVGAARGRRDTGALMLREAADVEFVDDRLDERRSEWRVSLPVVLARIDDDALHRDGGVVAGKACGL